MRIFAYPLLALLACDPPPAPQVAADSEAAAEAPEEPRQAPQPPPERVRESPAPAAATSEIVLPALREGEKAGRDASGPRTIGVHRELPQIAPESAWTIDADGAPVWRVTIRSTGAVALRLHFTAFRVGDGRVTVREAAREVEAGARAYTADGPADDGELWTDILEGEAVIVEYRPADSGVESRDAPFRIDRLSHIWVSPLDAF